jgi:hypothetical protein
MSTAVHDRVEDQKIELGTSVNWPVIYAAAALSGLVVTAVLLLCLFAGPAPAPTTPPTVAQRPLRAWEQDIPLPPLPPADATPHVSVPPVTPPVAKAEPPRPPTPPAKPIVYVKPGDKRPEPVVEPTPAPSQTQVAQEKPAAIFKRRQQYGEVDLRERLEKDIRELDVEAVKGTTATLLASVSTTKPKQTGDNDTPRSEDKTPSIQDLLAKRDDLKGLPVRKEKDCKAPEKEAVAMAQMSQEVRRGMASIARPDVEKKRGSYSSEQTYGYDWQMVSYIDKCLKGREWREDAGVRLEVQMFQAENYPARMKILSLLADTKGKTATVALAQRAVFDLDPEVREATIKALKDRSAEDYRPVLLEALRYPWAPVADHAAEALVALNDRDAISHLVTLLDKPDPMAPRQTKNNKWVEPELVRINHLGNCVLCHAPCSASEKTVRGLVPERDKPLPVMYYQSTKGIFVRADVTYLRQDFSLMHLVEDSGKWPKLQRFDYLIRQRELCDDEVSLRVLSGDDIKANPGYKQRDAALWALRELTGKDCGESSADWAAYLKKESAAAAP